MNVKLEWFPLMSTNSALLGLSILFVFLDNPMVAAQTNSSEVKNSLEEKARICSIFGVLTANAEAIKQGDVLFLERTFYDGFKPYAPTQDGTLDEFRLVRVVFDDDQGKFLVLSRTISEWLAFEDVTEENDGRTIRTKEQGVFCDTRSRIHQTKQDNLIFKNNSKYPLPESCWVLSEDPRTGGMCQNSLRTLSSTIERLSIIQTGEKLLDSRIESNGVHIRLEIAKVPPNSRVVASYIFDHDSNLPTQVEGYGESLAGGGGRSIPHRGNFKWKTMSGLHVLVQLKGSSYGGYDSPNGVRIDASKTKEINFHWFSINEPIPDELFDEANLSDSKRFQDLIDPRTANATELLEIIEKLAPKFSLAPDKEPTAPK